MPQPRQKSLKLNMVLNAVRGLMSILFPLITFPYVSKTLGVDNIGQYNFANSIISYFILLAELGIGTYAIREGSRVREDERKLESFASEIFSINIISALLSYILFSALLFVVPKFQNYRAILLILSLQIIFKTIGIEWVYSIYEDYAYITIRSIFFQIISLILLFLLVNSKDDVNYYAIITVFSGVGSNLINFIHSRKYIRIKAVHRINWKKHLKPILVLFAMSATITVYVSSDVTMLGFLVDDYTVGIYSVSTKVYSIVKTLLASVLVVSIPRLSALLGQNDYEGFSNTANDIYKTLITVVAPAITGIFILRYEIVLLLSDIDFLASTSSLSLLSIALFFCMGAWYWGQCILVPNKKENVVFKVTIASATVNIVLNFFLIPFWKENAAAFTTILAEGLSFIWCGIEGKKIIDLVDIWKHYLKVLIGCILVLLTGTIIHLAGFSYFINICLIVPLSVVIYFVFEMLIKNDSVVEIANSIKSKIFHW